ncbi:TrbC/VirB2 family protein [Ehrlichia ruminantium]|uniref:TrbC/VirB2 family protein n=1 Tax=Ehrlichia ruminantium TaxID=779 RepID=UPI0015DD0EFA|nr:TrbC/VirB2 family protein [Ehrlichia ruminantium]QLK53649.1 TrbC/VirB2 family protein [Ehrlichia ruminantium]QLK59143.1 TrbC/VirB2 family protein [Ehrlichia ruminantium]
MIKFLLVFFVFMGFVCSMANAQSAQASSNGDDDTVTKVICNVINFVQKLGLPIMTGVILGSSIMAIFGKLPWPAIVMLVVFTAIFFGAGKLMHKFANGISSVSTNGKDVCQQAGAAGAVTR